MRSIADSFGSKADDGTSGKIGRYLALVNYNTNPITSAMFITATAPNPLIVTLIVQEAGKGAELSWSMWAVAAFLPALISLIIMPLVIYFLYKPEITATLDALEFARERIRELGPVSLPEKSHSGSLSFCWHCGPACLAGCSAVNIT